MNILYLGPYRQNSIYGINSLFVVQTLLNSKNNVTCRPLYINHRHSPANAYDDTITKAELNVSTNYDILIQHTYVENCIKINNIKKNICIPILKDNNLNKLIIEHLSEFDTILVDNRLDYHRLSQHKKIQNKVKIYDYDINISKAPQSPFNVGVYNAHKKLYFIGDYDENITNIHNLCRSFIVNSHLNNEAVLLLFVTNLNEPKKSALESMIQSFYNQSDISYSTNKILIIPIEFNLDNLIVAHQTGNIFVDLVDNSTNSFHTKISSILKKSIIQFEPADLELTFNRNNFANAKGFLGIKEESVNSSIQKHINSTQITLTPTKKHHINSII